MAKGDNIRERLVNFAVMVIDLCEQLPKTAAATHISMQLLRAATAAAPNYAEARGAESARDFVHKLGIALKEMNEAEVWLDIILRKGMGDREIAIRVREECGALCRMLAASVKTAGTKLSRLSGV